MTPAERLVGALRGALETAQAIAGRIAVFDAPPVRAARPYLVIDEPVESGWGAQGVDAREYRIAIRVHDAGERPLRLRAIGEAVDEAMRGLPRDLNDGWGLASVALVRARTLREGGDRWVLASEWRVRMVAEL
jgi:hypothetical protein